MSIRDTLGKVKIEDQHANQHLKNNKKSSQKELGSIKHHILFINIEIVHSCFFLLIITDTFALSLLYLCFVLIFFLLQYVCCTTQCLFSAGLYTLLFHVCNNTNNLSAPPKKGAVVVWAPKKPPKNHRHNMLCQTVMPFSFKLFQ